MQTRPSLIFVSLGHFSLLSSHSNPSQDHCRPSSTFAVVLRSLRDLFREARATKKTFSLLSVSSSALHLLLLNLLAQHGQKTILPSTSTLSPQLLTFFLFWRCKRTPTHNVTDPPPPVQSDPTRLALFLVELGRKERVKKTLGVCLCHRL